MAAQTHEGWRGWWPSILVLVVVLEALLIVYLLRPHSGPFVLSPGDPLTRDGVAMMMICKPYGWHGTPDHTARYYLEPDYALAERGNWTKRDRGIASCSTTTTGANRQPAPTATVGDRTGLCIRLRADPPTTNKCLGPRSWCTHLVH
jgi:hypothetical protein